MVKAVKVSLMLSAALFLGVAGRKAWLRAIGQEVPRMLPDELNTHLNDETFVIIDTRAEDHWEASASKIRGAIRETAENVADWSSKYQTDKNIVLYCA